MWRILRCTYTIDFVGLDVESKKIRHLKNEQ